MATQADDDGMSPDAFPRRPCITSPGAKFATVVIGKESKSFTVHKELLTHYSGFFRAALTGRFKEAAEKRVVLGEEDPWIFEFFVHWLYYQRLPDRRYWIHDHEDLIKKWHFDPDSDATSMFSTPNSDHFVNLYLFSDRYDIKALGKCAIDRFYDCLEMNYHYKLPTFELANKAFECLTPKSPMCRFLVDAFCHHSNRNMFEKNKDDASPLFMFHVSRRYTELYQEGRMRHEIRIKICDYHDHKTQMEKTCCISERARENCYCGESCAGSEFE